MIIAQQDARQAIRETMAEARINDDDAAYIETLLMRRLNEYKTQPIELKEAKKDLEMCETMACEDANLVALLSKWIHRLVELVNG
jgi:hypothetical protein